MESQTDVFASGQDGYNTYRIPALVVTAKGTALLFCEGRRNSWRDYGDIDLLLKRSDDGGRTWSAQTVVHGEGGSAEIFIGNPCPIVDRDGKTLHLLMTRNNRITLYTRSTDEGRTWATPRELPELLKGFDFAAKRIATGPIHGIQASSGRLLAPIWLCDGMVQDKLKTYRAGTIYSDDGGATWLAGGLVPPVFPELNECALLERLDGSLVLNIRGANKGWRAVSASRDGGMNWSEPSLDKALPCSTCQASLIRHSGEHVVFANPAVRGKGRLSIGERNNMSLAFSFDDGHTWPERLVLNPGPSGYSDLAVLPDGTILCAYERGENIYHEQITVARIRR